MRERETVALNSGGFGIYTCIDNNVEQNWSGYES